MKIKRVAIVLVIVIGLAAGGFLAYQQLLAAEDDASGVGASVVEANTLSVDTGSDEVMAEGKLAPLRHADLSFQTGGQIVEIMVKEWDSVVAGQPLVQLEAAELQAGVAQAEAGLEQAEAALAVADMQVETAQVGVQAAEVDVTAAQAQLSLSAAEPLTQEIASLQANIATAEAAIAQAAAHRAVSVSGATGAQIQSAQAQVAAAAAEERVTQDQYDQLIRHDVGGTSEEQLRYALQASEAALAAAELSLAELAAGPTNAERWAASATVPVAEAQRDAAQAQLDLLLAGVRPEQIAIAQVGVERAEVSVAQAQAVVAEAEVARGQAAAAVTQAETALAAAQMALNKMTLRAPFGGTVAKLDVKLGQVVSPGFPIIVLADQSGWLVETTDLTELDVVALRVGGPAIVRIDALPDETFSGRVTDIAAVSTLNRGDVTYVATIALDENLDLPLRWGMTVLVTVQVGQ